MLSSFRECRKRGCTRPLNSAAGHGDLTAHSENTVPLVWIACPGSHIVDARCNLCTYAQDKNQCSQCGIVLVPDYACWPQRWPELQGTGLKARLPYVASRICTDLFAAPIDEFSTIATNEPRRDEKFSDQKRQFSLYSLKNYLLFLLLSIYLS